MCFSLSQNIKKKDAAGGKSRPAAAGGLLPPPPGGKSGGVLSPPPPGPAFQTAPPTQHSTGNTDTGIFMVQTGVLSHTD